MARPQGKPAQATLLIKKTVVILCSLQLVPPPSNTHMLGPVEDQMWSTVWSVSPKREINRTEQTKAENRPESFRCLQNANRGIQDPPYKTVSSLQMNRFSSRLLNHRANHVFIYSYSRSSEMFSFASLSFENLHFSHDDV